MNKQEFQYTNISAANTTGAQIFTGRGLLRAVVVNTTAAGPINVTDGLLVTTGAGSGTTGNVGIMQASILPGTQRYDVSISKGLTIANTAASNITIVWAQD
jgi:hypothetical protein